MSERAIVATELLDRLYVVKDRRGLPIDADQYAKLLRSLPPSPATFTPMGKMQPSGAEVLTRRIDSGTAPMPDRAQRSADSGRSGSPWRPIAPLPDECKAPMPDQTPREIGAARQSVVGLISRSGS
jgi:hypothetical protein